MLFNSFIFIFIFLPITIIGYFLLNKLKLVTLAKIFLVIASLIFYGYWNIKYVPLIILSVVFNFMTAKYIVFCIEKEEKKIKNPINKNLVLTFGVCVNLLVLGYYKYCDFFIENFNFIFKTHISFLHIVLPLAISFFTFQQIAYLADSSKGKTKNYSFLNYALFVTFFPQLIAGPIVRHNEVMPQIQQLKTKIFNWKNFANGLFLFIIGLTKKVVIADIFSQWADNGYFHSESMSTLSSWVVILSYTFQIYYDFSGYTDMALGIAKMLNIYLPQNFNNPYSAISVEYFWQKWHMTLSRFLRDYVYIPLGGNRTFLKINTQFSAYINTLIVFFICGLWHGASWMFVIWGMCHGTAVCVNKFLRKKFIHIPEKICWIFTFIYINLTWVFFRSGDITTAKNILYSAFNFKNLYLPQIHYFKVLYNHNNVYFEESLYSLFLPLFFIIFIFYPVFDNLKNKFKPTAQYLVISVILSVLCITKITNPTFESPFIYFNF